MFLARYCAGLSSWHSLKRHQSHKCKRVHSHHSRLLRAGWQHGPEGMQPWYRAVPTRAREVRTLPWRYVSGRAECDGVSALYAGLLLPSWCFGAVAMQGGHLRQRYPQTLIRIGTTMAEKHTGSPPAPRCGNSDFGWARGFARGSDGIRIFEGSEDQGRGPSFEGSESLPEESTMPML